MSLSLLLSAGPRDQAVLERVTHRSGPLMKIEWAYIFLVLLSHIDKTTALIRGLVALLYIIFYCVCQHNFLYLLVY